jgi:hypothetical protein
MPCSSGVICPRKNGTMAPQVKRGLRAYSRTWCSSFSPKPHSAVGLASDPVRYAEAACLARKLRTAGRTASARCSRSPRPLPATPAPYHPGQLQRRRRCQSVEQQPVADAHGNPFGTTLVGGANGEGTVFETRDSGFSTHKTPSCSVIESHDRFVFDPKLPMMQPM